MKMPALCESFGMTFPLFAFTRTMVVIDNLRSQARIVCAVVLDGGTGRVSCIDANSRAPAAAHAVEAQALAGGALDPGRLGRAPLEVDFDAQSFVCLRLQVLERQLL